GRCLLDVAQTLTEGEVGRLDGVLEKRSVNLVVERVEEGRVALELREPERRAQAPHHRVHHVRDDVVCVVELDAGEKAGVAGDVGDHETGGFGFRRHEASLSGVSYVTSQFKKHAPDGRLETRAASEGTGLHAWRTSGAPPDSLRYQ